MLTTVSNTRSPITLEPGEGEALWFNNDLLTLWQQLRRTVIFVTHSVFESVFLSQRILVMTPRPGRVSTELAIDAPRRDAEFRTSAEYAGYCRVTSAVLAQVVDRVVTTTASTSRSGAGATCCASAAQTASRTTGSAVGSESSRRPTRRG